MAKADALEAEPPASAAKDSASGAAGRFPTPDGERPKRFVWAFGSVGYYRHFRTVIELQLQQGHEIFVLYEKTNDLDAYVEDENALRAYPNFHCELLPKKLTKYSVDKDLYALRCTWDYLRYFHPTFKDADYLKSRVEPDALPGFVKVGKTGLFRFTPFRLLAEKYVAHLEEKRPVDPLMVNKLASFKPDAVMLSPLIRFGSRQTDFVRAARQLGLPSVLCVASWDNLSNKGAIRVIPDKVVVWNDEQIEEAVDFHYVPRERVITTGAQTFDTWFERKPTVDRKTFCEALGLDPGRKLIAYLCSSGSIGGEEWVFIEKWLAAVRSAKSGPVADAQVLIRPHPKNRGQWGGQDSFQGAPVWPLGDEGFYGRSGADCLFNTLWHADVHVGLNTTAMIEAAILNRPVLTPQLNEMPEVQRATEQMYHFRYISEETGGFVRISHTMERHLEQLAESLEHPERFEKDAKRFIARFVRPRGSDVPAVEVLAQELDAIAVRR